MSLFGDFEHHLQISVGNYIPKSWVMFNLDIYQPLWWLIFSNKDSDVAKVRTSGTHRCPWLRAIVAMHTPYMEHIRGASIHGGTRTYRGFILWKIPMIWGTPYFKKPPNWFQGDQSFIWISRAGPLALQRPWSGQRCHGIREENSGDGPAPFHMWTGLRRWRKTMGCYCRLLLLLL